MSARGRIPHALHDHWAGQLLAREICANGILSAVNGEVLKIPPNTVFFYREFEPATARVIRLHTQPGSVFVDVGANVGYYSVLAGRIAKAVHAFEPSPSNLPYLEENLRRHGMKNVTIHRVALSDKNGEVLFHLTADQLNDGIPPPAAVYSKASSVITVPTTRLDDLRLGQVDFVKMDIQGAEIEALSGMVETIKQNPEIKILVEWSPACLKEAGHDAKDLPEWFYEHGLANMIALDDFQEGERTVDEMLDVFANDKTGAIYCNLFARAR